MLRKYSNHRTQQDNLMLGALTAFSAGMTNVVSVIVFFAFTSNITGYYAVFSQEISKGNWYQGAVVLLWIVLFFVGSLVSNSLIIHGKGRWSPYIAHAIPVILEIICILGTGIYLEFFYQESLQETEFLVGALLFAMGLQNGLTASISNSVVKTTHLTGLSTDLAILVSMFAKREHRRNVALVAKFHLLLAILFSYVIGGLTSGLVYNSIGNKAFYVVCIVLLIIALYDYYKLKMIKYRYDRRHRAVSDSIPEHSL